MSDYERFNLAGDGNLYNDDDYHRLVDESSRRIEELESALKDCVHVIEKGIAVRIGDHWPILKDLLPDTLKKAKEALSVF